MEHESSAIESLAKTRQRLSSPCKSKSKRVCVVCHFVAFRPATDEFVFFIVDCDSSSGDEYTHMEPTVRYKLEEASPPPVTFCAIESTLYMFEGVREIDEDEEDDHSSDGGRIDEDEEDDHHSPGRRGGSDGGRFAGKFVIPKELYDGSGIYGALNLKKGDLFEMKGMHEKKYSVQSLPTPDGKSILVFSSTIDWYYDGSFGDSFELYNVDQDSWEVLPRLPHKRYSNYYSNITAFEFETESHFLIQMEDEILVLDLKASSRAWKLSSVCTIPNAGHFLSSGGLYFFAGYAYDSGDGGRTHYLTLSSFPDEDAYLALVPPYLRDRGTMIPSITSLCCADGVYDRCCACTVRSRSRP